MTLTPLTNATRTRRAVTTDCHLSYHLLLLGYLFLSLHDEFVYSYTITFPDCQVW